MQAAHPKASASADIHLGLAHGRFWQKIDEPKTERSQGISPLVSAWLATPARVVCVSWLQLWPHRCLHSFSLCWVNVGPRLRKFSLLFLCLQRGCPQSQQEGPCPKPPILQGPHIINTQIMVLENSWLPPCLGILHQPAPAHSTCSPG